MLTQNTLETLRHLKLHGMAQALEEQRDTPNTHALSFEERLALLVDRERLSRQNSRYRGLLRDAEQLGDDTLARAVSVYLGQFSLDGLVSGIHRMEIGLAYERLIVEHKAG